MKIEEIEKLCEQATKGPWGYTYDGSSDWSVGPSEDPQSHQIASCYRRYAVDNPDAEFIAASREFVPWAIEELKAKDRRIQKLERIVSAIQMLESYKQESDDPYDIPIWERELEEALEDLEKE